MLKSSYWPSTVDSKMILDPSGDQRGLAVMNAFMDVSFTVFEPSSSATQISRAPLRSDTKAMCLPSGAYCGLASIRVDARNARGVRASSGRFGISVRQMLMSVEVRAYTNLPCRETLGPSVPESSICNRLAEGVPLAAIRH